MILESFRTGDYIFRPLSKGTKIVTTVNPERAYAVEQSLYTYFSVNNDMHRYLHQATLIGLGLAQTTFTGYYSNVWNTRLRTDPFDLKLLNLLHVLTIKDIFPELYDNDQLSIEEKTIVNQKVTNELQALYNSLKLDVPPIRYFPESDTCIDKSDGISECYHHICMTHTYQITGVPQYVTTYVPPSYNQFFHDIGPSGTEIFCLPTQVLLSTIDTINPLTKRSYSEKTRKDVYDKFKIEIALIKYSQTHVPSKL
jgi:hypothetical protein